MKKDYVIIKIIPNKKIKALKVDEKLNKINYFEKTLKQNQEQNLKTFAKFLINTNIITNNAKKELSYLLKLLYENKITTSFCFKYFDLNKDYSNGKSNIDDTLNKLKKYMEINNFINLKELFINQPNKGKIFRGLNYPKYLCDILTENKKYYGYIIDNSLDKFVSYYASLKEIEGNYFTLEEIYKLKEKEAKIIMNVSYLDKESVKFTDLYSVQAVDINFSNQLSKKLIEGINNFVNYNKNNKKLNLILWGSIDNLKKNYKIIGKKILKEFILQIDLIKKPWDYFEKLEFEK